MMTADLSPLFIGSAFVAGILSFLSPCVLPLVPVYLGYLTGSLNPNETDRRTLLTHASAFIIGFASIFTVLGASVGLIGFALQDRVPLLVRIGGLVVILMGLHLLGVIRIPWLYMEKRLDMERVAREPNIFASYGLGIVFGAGWTPCVGPVLSAILGLAYTSGTALQGAFLLAVYSAGLGIPFLLTALGAERLLTRLRPGPWLRRIEQASGVLLIAVGLLLLSNRMTVLNSYLIRITPDWLLNLL